MGRHREELLREVEDRLSTVARWLAARRVAAEQGFVRLRAHLESVRRGVREDAAHAAHEAAARARATLDDLDRELAAPPGDAAIDREELDAMRHHLRVTAALLPHVYDLDDPDWGPAHEAYERSWEELSARVGRGDAPSR